MNDSPTYAFPEARDLCAALDELSNAVKLGADLEAVRPCLLELQVGLSQLLKNRTSDARAK